MKIYSSVVCLHNTKAELLYLGWSYYTENFQPPLPRFHLNRVGSQLTGSARFSYYTLYAINIQPSIPLMLNHCFKSTFNTTDVKSYLGWSYYTENFQPPLPRFHLNRVGSQLTESARLVWLRFTIS